jgi:natural product biosynthesis luciferase-like monooxygenase protein
MTKAFASAGALSPEFSIFYFADAGQQADKYTLLLEGARFADDRGFSAVWTPERHFHPFGGLYPNPAVTGAAIATITKRVNIRAGSVVAPLSHPLRIAEDWAVVDNLSNGRVGVSFASGWHARDFALAPENYENRREVLVQTIDVVRRLWRGEAVVVNTPMHNQEEYRSYPRPIQSDLPVWVTSAGNQATFRLAGDLGANVLTHLLGQSSADLKSNIKVYRAAHERRHGHSRGWVTLMVHTFMADDSASATELARAPFIVYLKSSLDLIGGLARSLGDPDIDPATHSADDIDFILQRAADRYMGSSGLFGNPMSCLPIVEQLVDAGVDEIACLIDFGVDSERVLSSLEHVARLRDLVHGHRGSKRGDRC